MKKSNKILTMLLDELENISNNDVLTKIEAYFCEDKNEDFLEQVEEADFNILDHEQVNKLGQVYTLMRKSKNLPYIKKYVKLLFKMYKGQAAHIICKDLLVGGTYTEDEILLEADIDNYIVAAIHSYVLTYGHRTQRLKKENYKIIYDICRKDKGTIIKALNYVEPLYKIILSSLYCYVIDDDGSKEFILYMENYLLENINNVYLNRLTKEEEEALKELLLKDDGINSISHDLKENIVKLEIDDKLFRIFACASGMNSKKSKIINNVYNLLVTTNYSIALDVIFASIIDKDAGYSYSMDKESILKIVNHINNTVKIKKQYFLFWFMENYLNNEYSCEIIKENILSNKEEYKEVIKNLTPKYKFILSSIALEEFNDECFIEYLKESLCDLFEFTLKERFIQSNNEQIKSIKDYIYDNKSFEYIYDILTSNMCLKGKTYYGRELSAALSFKETIIKNKTDLYSKAILILAALCGSDIIYNLSRGDYANIFNLLEENNVSVELQMSLIDGILESCQYNYGDEKKKFTNVAQNILKKHKEDVLKYIKNMKADCRMLFIMNIAENESEENIKILCDNFSDSANSVFQFIFKYLKDKKQYSPIVLEKAYSKKVKDREMAVKLLCEYKLENSRDIFEELLKKEKSEKIKKMLKSILNIKEQVTDLEKSNKSDEEIYVEKEIQGVKPSLLKWLDIKTLPKIRVNNKEEYCSDEYLKLLITGYYYASKTQLTEKLRKMAEILNKDDLKVCAREVLQRWIANYEESKTDCAMIFSAVYGDEALINDLINKIKEWPKAGRHGICGDALRGFALNGSKKCLLEISKLSKKAKNKGVKNGAIRAMSMYCSIHNMTTEELEDRIIPDLGFNEEFEIYYDYGKRKFKARLNQNLELEIYDEKDKKIKNLPAANKNDDEEKVKKAKANLKELKKDLKDTISIQTIRLTEAMINNKKWSVKEYKEVFIENLIMNLFAYSQIFGVYEKKEDGCKLINTFKYMNDGTYSDKNEEEFDINTLSLEKNLIGIVHPIELCNEEIKLWENIIDDYEIVQPICQIYRNVYKVHEENMNLFYVNKFENQLINGLTLVNKLKSMGWSRGEIGDNACYNYLEKVNYNKEFFAILEIETTAIGIENTDLAVGKLKFYKGHNFKQAVKLADVEPKFYSEILYDIEGIFR